MLRSTSYMQPKIQELLIYWIVVVQAHSQMCVLCSSVYCNTRMSLSLDGLFINKIIQCNSDQSNPFLSITVILNGFSSCQYTPQFSVQSSLHVFVGETVPWQPVSYKYRFKLRSTAWSLQPHVQLCRSGKSVLFPQNVLYAYVIQPFHFESLLHQDTSIFTTSF